MKKHRRIEITTFRRRITIVSGHPSAERQTDAEVCINDADSTETIETDSAEGQRLLLEAVHLLEEKIARQGESKK